MTDSSSNNPSKSSRKQKSKFPLSQYHGNNANYWCKKIRGKRVYFEQIKDDPDGTRSLAIWLAQKEALLAGHRPKPQARNPTEDPAGANSGLMLKDIANHWMSYNGRKLESKEITKRSHDEYFNVCQLLFSAIPKERNAQSIGPEDFADLRAILAKRYGPVGLAKRMIQVRSLFKYAFEQELLDRPIRYGKSFELPSAKTMRKHRSSKGRLDFSREEILAMLSNVTPNQKAMILLGLNGGLGNSDVADLPLTAIDLKHGWADYPREKTGTERRIPLWPETTEAIREVLSKRPKVNSPLLFISKRGNDYQDGEQRTGAGTTGEFRQVLKRAGIEPRSRGFYSLRRTFQTQAEMCGDLVAVKAIMGHTFSERDMSARYRQAIDDSRLRKAVSVVHSWLFDTNSEPQTK